jgi:hypothetical protein
MINNRKNNKCVRCQGIGFFNLKDDPDTWFCIAHGMEYADIKSGKYEKRREV